MKKFILLTILLTSVLIIGCEKQQNSLVIAQQFGIAYAPIEIMKSEGYLEEELKKMNMELNVEYISLGNTSQIREMMLSGEVTVGYGAIPPFLIGIDNGMDWKAIGGLSKTRVSLISNDNTIDRTNFYNENVKIILPQPGSIQHILISMFLDKEGVDYNQIEKNILSMTHPDGVTAMSSLNNDKLVHFTTPPYIQKELEIEENRVILESTDCLKEEFTFAIGFCTEDFYNNENAYKAYNNAIKRAIDLLNNDKIKSIEILSKNTQYAKEDLELLLSTENTKFSTTINGMEDFYNFMKKSGMLKNEINVEKTIWK
jgi:NitT/TauT family transport system substrate-binding protein